MRGTIIKDDNRYGYTEEYLKKRGVSFDVYENSDLDIIIFPFKGEPDQSIYKNSYFASLKKEVHIFSGLRNEYLSKKCKEYGLSYYVMLEAPSVQINNAIPTSEGVIEYIITNRTNTIHNSRILIIGYGVCGSDLAKRLKVLGADVYALVRNKEKESLAFSDSITPIYLNELSCTGKLRAFDVIVNTVPTRIFTNEMTSLTGDTLLIDIASSPYGFDIELAKKNNEKSAILPAIPSKYAIKTAGEILGAYIFDIVTKGKGTSKC